MQVHYSLAQRQVRDQVYDLSADVSALPYCNPRLVVDVVSLDPGTYANIRIALTKDGSPVVSTTSRINSIGRSQIGIGQMNATGLIAQLHVEIVGRMRFSVRVVSFEQYEDVPESF